MKRILIVTNHYFTPVSANGICLEQIVNCMADLSVICDVIAFGNVAQTMQINEHLTVHFIKSRFSMCNNVISKTIRYLIKMFIITFLSPDTNIINHKKMLRKALSLINIYHYDAVIPSSGGFAIQKIGLRIKEKTNIKLIPMFYDPPPSYNFLYKKGNLYYRSFLRLQTEVFEKSDGILIWENIYDDLAVSNKNVKCKKITIPLLMPHAVHDCKNNEKVVVFTGSLYRDIRNPQYAIELLTRFPALSIRFYGTKQTETVLLDFPHDNVKYMGLLDHDAIEKVICDSCYLLNIGNTITTQIPGKLIEYISFGKPIINIVKHAKDNTVELIEKYGNGVSLVEGDVENLEKLQRFFMKPYTIVPYEELRERFGEYTPEYNARILNSCL